MKVSAYQRMIKSYYFEPFHRGQNVGAISGTGLGLSIVKKSIQIHHGTLSINSEVNKGTEDNYNFTL